MNTATADAPSTTVTPEGLARLSIHMLREHTRDVCKDRGHPLTWTTNAGRANLTGYILNGVVAFGAPGTPKVAVETTAKCFPLQRPVEFALEAVRQVAAAHGLSDYNPEADPQMFRNILTVGLLDIVALKGERWDDQITLPTV